MPGGQNPEDKRTLHRNRRENSPDLKRKEELRNQGSQPEERSLQGEKEPILQNIKGNSEARSHRQQHQGTHRRKPKCQSQIPEDLRQTGKRSQQAQKRTGEN